MKMKNNKLILCLISLLLSQEAFAVPESCTMPNCPEGCTNGRYVRIAGKQQTFSTDDKKQNFSFNSLKLKRDFLKSIDQPEDKVEARSIAAASPISISADDFDEMSDVRTSWVNFQDVNINFSMDIGAADGVNAQNWAFPSNLLSVYDSLRYEDFIPLEEVPVDLRFPGANKVLKGTVLDLANNDINVYNQ